MKVNLQQTFNEMSFNLIVLDDTRSKLLQRVKQQSRKNSKVMKKTKLFEWKSMKFWELFCVRFHGENSILLLNAVFIDSFSSLPEWNAKRSLKFTSHSISKSHYDSHEYRSLIKPELGNEIHFDWKQNENFQDSNEHWRQQLVQIVLILLNNEFSGEAHMLRQSLNSKKLSWPIPKWKQFPYLLWFSN